MKVLGIILARGGSKGIPGKNIHLLGGKPLVAWTIEAARKSALLTRLILSSDSEEIIDVAKGYGVDVPFVRPRSLAGDDTPALPVVQHAVEHISTQDGCAPDIVVLLQPTSPLRRTVHIDESLQRLIDSEADSIVSVVKVHHNYSPISEMVLREGYLLPYVNWEEKNNLRQFKPAFYARNGAIYAFRHRCLVEGNSIYGEKILPYEMAREESIDVDDLFDLEFCEFLLARRKD